MCATMKYVSVCCRSDGGDECMMPESPPMMNMAMKPMANSIGVSRRSLPPHMVAIQLKIFTPVGMAMSMVVDANTESAMGPRPTENMWWLQTPQPMKAIRIPE